MSDDYGSLINQSFGQQNPALPSVVGNISEDPERAQRAMDLSKATGVPSTAIFGDLDEFERQNKATMASSIVQGNPHLADFVQRNPMVPKLANDDYGNLDEVSNKVSAMGWLWQTTKNSVAAMAKPPAGFGDQGIGSWISPDDWHDHPLGAAIASTIFAPVEVGMRALNAATLEATTTVLGKDKGEAAAQMVMDPGLQASLAGLGPHGALLAGALGTLEKFAPASTWLSKGKAPPIGVMPELDKANLDVNSAGVDALKDATSSAQQSLLRERNPELFKQFMEQHTNAEIGINGEAAAALYGDKVPTPDDNLLGWVPDIESKLNLARATGDDVKIPLADWLANENAPDLMTALHDDIRIRPDGITANEAKLASEAKDAQPPSVPLSDDLPLTRASAALEPLFSIGDRKLALARLKGAEGSRFGPEQGFHDFAIADEKGNPVGTINLSEAEGGKQLYIDMINGINGLGPRDFGPSLMRDLLRQLKQEFPNAESITGHRVSGAREVAGSYMAKSAMPVVKLDNPNLEHFGQVLEGGKWEQYSPGIQAYIKPYAERSIEDRNLINIVSQELDRIAPNKLRAQATDRISATSSDGQRAGATVEPTGAYIAYKDAYPILLYALEGDNPLGTARHEVIHHLRGYGFFDKNEWFTLEKAASDNDWHGLFKIDERYPKADPALRTEEAIADAYKEWESGRFEAMPEVQTIFEKMKAFFDALREHIAKLLGKPPTWEDIFQKVSTGEVGAREGTEPLDARAFNEKLQVSEEPEGGSRVFERAAALGMTVDQFKRYDQLMQQRYAEDIAESTKRAEAEQAKEHTKQWKADRKALRVEVSSDIRNRPDVAADLFFGEGDLYGKKLESKVKLDADSLTPEQKATLPKDYYGSAGLHPDDVANLFGYGSGDAMVERLGQYNQAKLAANMSAKDFVSRITDIETDRQMRVRHGVLEDNIADAVKEQVTGETQQNLLHEETVALGMKAGQAPLDKATILAELRDQFSKMPLGSVSSDAYMRAAGKAGRQAELALLGEDPATAFRAKQQQYYATVIANEAAKLEKEMGKFDKLAKRFSKREVPAVDQEYTNFIHDILMRVGKPVRRSIQDLETEIAAGEYKDLKSFVEGKNGFYLREVAVDDRLFDPNYRKTFEQLTVDEFNGVNTSIKSMLTNGRDEKKITKAGTEADLNEIKQQMIGQLQRFQEQTYDAKGGRAMGLLPAKQASLVRGFGIDHLQMETIFNRWDGADPQGPFQQYVMRDLVAAANSESAKRKVYADRLMKLADDGNLKASVDNTIFKVPDTNQLPKFTRANLRAVLLNVGNESNLDKLARGYKLEKQQVLDWVNRHATPEDWQWAQKMGDVFADLKAEADVMYRNISGVAPESIKLDPIQTPHGEMKGWYYPLIAHPEFEGGVKKMMGPDALEQAGYIRATTANGYTKARTGVAYPLALDLDMLPQRIAQMIHDTEMRPAVINASKIFYDKDIRSTVFTRFGAEWRDMMVPYLVDVANGANYMAKNQKRLTAASEFIRQNMITTLVGLNPGTFLKHTPTALVQSIHEVGADNFLRAMRGMWSVNERTSESNWQFAMRESEELQRRHTHFQETLGGAGDQLVPDKGFASLRSTVNYYASKPVAMGDLFSAVPTWLAQYTKEMDAGSSHGDAVYMADRAVRRAHGSTAITNRSAVMRGGYNPWFASVYGFFNHIMNRQYEATWKAGEAIDMVKNKEGTFVDAMQDAQKLTANLWAYVLAPAIIEELVSPLSNDEHESWGMKAAKGLTYTLGSSWIGIRDLANAILNGRDPSLGLSTTALKSLTDVFRDATKNKPLGKEHAGKLVKDASTLLGTATGLLPAQVGKLAEFGYGVAEGTERPKGPWGWLTGARFGTTKGHPATFNEWQRHHLGGR